MVELYETGAYSKSYKGITLHPSKCEVTFDGAARYDLDLEFPLMAEGYLAVENQLLDYGSIIRASVPPQHIPEINLGSVYTWKVKTGQSAQLLKSLPYQQKVAYMDWTPGRSYMAGDKVRYAGQNFQCATGHGGITTPPPQNPTLWTALGEQYITVNGTVIETLSAGTQFIKLGDCNTTYMRAQHGNNIGYIEISKCEYAQISEQRTIPARDITAQAFRITEITRDTKSGTVSVHAVHLSYLLNGQLLDECNLVQATPQNALAAVYAAMMETWPGDLLTNITTGEITNDYTNRMAGDVLLNPSDGLVTELDARVIRDDQSIVLVSNTTENPVYSINYGVNLLGVTWTVNIDDIVTRVYPVAKDEDDSTLWIASKYIDSLQTHDWVVMELLETGLKVGMTEKKSDGTETTLTKNQVLQRMAEMAQARFDKDHCDVPVITLDVNFFNIADTEEYAQYKGLQTIAPYDWVNVKHGPLDLEADIQLIGYTWDSVNDKYIKVKFGDVKQYAGRNIADYDLRNGAVTARVLSKALRRSLNV